MSEINSIVGMMIRQHRTAKNITQEELATQIDMSRPSVVNMEQGSQNITVERLYKIAEVLEVPIHCFFPNSQAQQELMAIEREYEIQMEAWRQKYS